MYIAHQNKSLVTKHLSDVTMMCNIVTNLEVGTKTSLTPMTNNIFPVIFVLWKFITGHIFDTFALGELPLTYLS